MRNIDLQLIRKKARRIIPRLPPRRQAEAWPFATAVIAALPELPDSRGLSPQLIIVPREALIRA